MFTGIVEELGRVRSIERRGEGVRMTVEARAVTEGTREGDSIAVNGVCLTALDVRRDSLRPTARARPCSARRWGPCAQARPSTSNVR